MINDNELIKRVNRMINTPIIVRNRNLKVCLIRSIYSYELFLGRDQSDFYKLYDMSITGLTIKDQMLHARRNMVVELGEPMTA